MEPHQQQVQQGNEEGGKNVNSSGSFLCRQSSTRWTPTTDQIRILKDLYYNNGVRSPTAEQIQRISAKLRQYGKIEGKNVFYWFQNHKARERQKKRFTTPVDHHHHVNVIPLHNNNSNNIRPGGVWKNDDVSTTVYNNSNKFPNIIGPGGFPSSSTCASPGFVPVGNYGYGSVAMEKSFRECSITQSGGAAANNYSSGGSMGHKFAWIGTVDHQQYNHHHHHHPYTSSTHPFLESSRKYAADQQTLELNEDEEDDQETPEIETLPLFPIHGGGDNNMKQDRTRDRYFNVLQRRADDYNVHSGANRASLELTLNTYASIYPNSP